MGFAKLVPAPVVASLGGVDPRSVLRALADLAPVGSERVLDVTKGGQALVWLTQPEKAPRSKAIERLAGIDLLHREERLLRRGWAFIIGTVTDGEATRKVCLPLLAEPVRLERGIRGYRVVSAGDLELNPLVADRTLASAPGAAVPGWAVADGLPGWLAAGTERVGWVRAAAEAAGLPVTDVRTEARRVPRDTPLVGVVAAALYLTRDVYSTGLRDRLLSWAGRPGLERTALATVYRGQSGSDGAAAVALTGAAVGIDGAAAAGGRPDSDGSDGSDREVLSPLPLNLAQREVVRRARSEPLAVVSGPPGCGKSHSVVAAALEVVDRGGSVLIATQSSHAADVLGRLLHRYPGPTPVLFGDAEHREVIAGELGKADSAGTPAAALRAGSAAVRQAREQVRTLEAAIGTALSTEQLAASLDRWGPLIPSLAGSAPGAFEPDADLVAADLVATAALAGQPGGGGVAGWWRRMRQRRAERRLRRVLRADPGVPMEQLRAAIEAGRATRAAAQLSAGGGTDLGGTLRALVDADAALAAAVGRLMRDRATSAQRWSGDARTEVGLLAAALRAGRERRRELLTRMDGSALVRALPLWVGTVTDVEDLLPPVSGLFDLVILDEASHVDQIRAAPVLARAARALIVGDPRQLRFVSFVADVDVTATLDRYGLDGRVDVRRMSAYDLAAAGAPVTWLGEHYRSAPHLIEFSAHRFYQDRITLATRHPSNELTDAIEVVRVAGTVADGVNKPEVAAVVQVVRDLAAAGRTGIAVVTPFRAQAEALESALLAAFPVHEIELLGLRAGTVHAFQGSEAETVVASLGLVEGDAAGRRRFASEPNLFNVLITRARRRMVVVTSLDGAADGLVGEYLAYSAAAPPVSHVAAAEEGDWAHRLADELERVGMPARLGYPVGQWRVDICAGTGVQAVGLTCAVHRDGPAAHLERYRALVGAGWRMVDAFPSRWSGNPVEAALALAAPLSSTEAPATR
jgi:hypothetical protein